MLFGGNIMAKKETAQAQDKTIEKLQFQIRNAYDRKASISNKKCI